MNISVVIPTFDRAHTLGRAINSVLKQTHPASEIIVVDDGSTDETTELLAHWPDIQVITQSNQGVSAARNAGIMRAQGEWIAFLDSDDEWLPEKLELQTALIEQHPTFSLCHGNELWVRNGQPLKQLKKHHKQGGYIFENCLPLCVISPSAAMIKRSLFTEIGLFDTSLPACEDYDMWLRICAIHPVLYVEPPILRKYGGHDDQLSNKYWGMDRFRITALKKALDSDRLSETQAYNARTMLRKKALIYAKGARKHGRPDEALDYEKLASQFDE